MNTRLAPLNPQSLNRYAYALNNPTNLIDPLGLNAMAGVCFNMGYNDPYQDGRWVRTGVWCIGGGGGVPVGPGPEGPTGPGQKPVVTNPSQTGPQQQVIKDRLAQLLAALACDPECSSFLASQGKDPISYLKQIIDNGIYGHGDISMNGNPYSTGATNGGAPGMAIVVNNQGSFFNRTTPDGRTFSVGPRGYAGGSARAQGFILLHELGHTTGVLRPDAGIPPNGQLNDEDIQSHCKKTLDAIK